MGIFIDKTCFDECFLFHVINGRRYFFLKVYLYCEIFSTANVAVFFETSVLKEVRILRYLHYKSAVLIPKIQNEAIVYYTYRYLINFCR